MPAVALYDVVRDGPITLSATGNATEDFPLQAPSIDAGIQSLISYMLDPGLTISFQLAIVTGGVATSLGAFMEQAGSGHVRQEVINAGVVAAAGSSLRITVTAGSGTFSDIVFWYQKQV